MRTKEQYEALILQSRKRIFYLFKILEGPFKGPFKSPDGNIINILTSRNININDVSNPTEIWEAWYIFRRNLFESIYKSQKKINSYKQRIKKLKKI